MGLRRIPTLAKNARVGQPQRGSGGKGWASPPDSIFTASNIPTLNFAKNAKFRMGHPSLIPLAEVAGYAERS